MGGYPKTFNNGEGLNLSSRRPHTEFPLTPSDGRSGNAYRGGDPGPVRAFYNNGDRNTVDVGFHDQREAPRGPRDGSAHARTPYTRADHYPAPTRVDTSSRTSRTTSDRPR